MSDIVDVYLDVDGVLNAVCESTPPDWGWGDSIALENFYIRYSPAMVDRLNAFAARPDVRMHWLTTWNDEAPRELCPIIGLLGNAWPVLGKSHQYDDDLVGTWWKLRAAREHFLSNSNRAVWIDDDLMDTEAREWAAPFVASGDLLLVQPHTHRALTRDEFDAIEAWVDGPVDRCGDPECTDEHGEAVL